ncbi:MAG: tetratricopeptide repeat protein [Acidobacteriota bacterium]
MGVPPKTRLSGEETPANLKLSSWKEIAAYLDRDPRTVQLWEKQEGFPVHRHQHHARASVYAFTAEIDAWLQARSRQKAAAMDAAGSAEPVVKRVIRAPQFLRLAIYATVAVVLAGMLVTWLREGPNTETQPPGDRGALVVLPFEEQVSTDDSLAQALTEDVIAKLGGIAKIRVTGRPSAATLKGGLHAMLPMARHAHVAFILEGTLAEVGDQLHATVELLAAPEGTYLWGATYKRMIGPSHMLPDDMASEIAVDVTRKITGLAPSADHLRSNADLRARQLYLAGRFYWNQRDLEGLQKAIQLYEQALAIDPRYADAYAGLAEAYVLMTDRGVLSDVEAFRRAKAAARSALAIDSGCAEAHNALAFAIYRQDWDFALAEAEFRKATALAPNSAVAHQWYGEFLGDLMRYEESIAELRIAKDLDPLSPMVSSDLADGYLHAGRLTEAEAELKRVLDLYPDFLAAHRYRIDVALEQSDYAEAQAEAQLYFQRSGDRSPLDEVEIRKLAATGRLEQASATLHRALATPGYAAIRPFQRARLEFAAGQVELGYASLDRAYREHSWWMATMMVDPGFAAVRTQPRFLETAHRVGLPVSIPPPVLAMRTE